MPDPWKALAAQADSIVDAQWGSNVVLRPWTKGEYVQGGPDTTRPIVSAVGVFHRAPGKAVAPGYLGRGAMNAGISGRAIEADAWIDIREEPLNECQLAAPDRIEVIDEGELYEVSFIAPSATDKPRVYLIKISPDQ